ncbi:hypothetical protein PSV09DRAFT_2385394 [Bipolaris maydis]|uniref:uncharacterized protein n=1 Tax=Cochliobolus heterostrophus TaxID=5016 RepID=UPI0024DB2D34|nr:hypothetical protein PSV09DRAFT_2385394 [Bipolaris maydis]KAJ6266793.1 hypothetical protein PSV08DRAFT_405284 [Bipolaris maydis]
MAGSEVGKEKKKGSDEGKLETDTGPWAGGAGGMLNREAIVRGLWASWFGGWRWQPIEWVARGGRRGPAAVWPVWGGGKIASGAEGTRAGMHSVSSASQWFAGRGVQDVAVVQPAGVVDNYVSADTAGTRRACWQRTWVTFPAWQTVLEAPDLPVSQPRAPAILCPRGPRPLRAKSIVGACVRVRVLLLLLLGLDSRVQYLLPLRRELGGGAEPAKKKKGREAFATPVGTTMLPWSTIPSAHAMPGFTQQNHVCSPGPVQCAQLANDEMAVTD